MNTIVPDKKNRIAYLDVARGIGILLVVIGHITSEGSLIHTAIYSFHMPLFFILSGMTMKPTKLKQAFGVSIFQERKLIVQYIIWSVFYTLFDIVTYGMLEHTFRWGTVFWDSYQTVVMHGINVLWFLSTLLIIKVFVRTLDLQKENKKIMVLLASGGFITVAMAASSIRFLLGNRYSQLVYYPIVSILRPCMMLVFFLVGYTLVKTESRGGKVSNSTLSTVDDIDAIM